ncbi:hypothetical protein P153DRAFT_432723 [Dothidotthia symphoricarpi CBS 119687]|uniref:Uncharacterized protein n=1 Tax=Dothidotthia symphoricarpi CBS 119687 TaxID=1392245 RepID=A0A6A6A8U4_9PLEO|nr:uncharacterized protein P153DRAFT_432723 [Dothidotthia symphoricarpi CBS 119687]KAF2127625.1 hypothetical protein P153DRAFT_432723 [Dothidotthia symphoricarpi CBS 119687]
MNLYQLWRRTPVLVSLRKSRRQMLDSSKPFISGVSDEKREASGEKDTPSDEEENPSKEKEDELEKESKEREEASEERDDPISTSNNHSTSSVESDRKDKTVSTISPASTVPDKTSTTLAFAPKPTSQGLNPDTATTFESRSTTFATTATTRPPAATTVVVQLQPSPTQPDVYGAPHNLHHDKTLMGPGAEAAAITLSILGAVSLIILAFIYFRQRKRRQDDQNPVRDFSKTNHLRAPDSAYIKTNTISDRVDHYFSRSALFDAASYSRPKTLSTIHGTSKTRIPPHIPAPNPFVDPPRNKAFDVLAGRPRSTTLTDRESWIENPFKNPASDRFDPFGELQQKARKERVRYMEQIRMEAEAQKKKQMELGRGNDRMGSEVTVEGIGILDRSGNGAYV